jgi:hypothetical protein
MTSAVEQITQAPELERKINDLSTEANAIVVRDQPSLDRAGDMLKTIKATRAEIDATFDPIISKAWASHKEAVAQKKRVDAPFVEAERVLKLGIGGYLTEQERLRQAEELRLREEADRAQREAEAETRRLQAEAECLHAEEIERQIEEAEAEGASRAVIEHLASQPAPVVAVEPVFMPAPVVASTVTPVQGISAREIWSAEVTDIVALAAHIAANPQYRNLIAPNMTALNQLARSLKSAMRIPGVKAVSTSNIAARR